MAAPCEPSNLLRLDECCLLIRLYAAGRVPLTAQAVLEQAQKEVEEKFAKEMGTAAREERIDRYH